MGLLSRMGQQVAGGSSGHPQHVCCSRAGGVSARIGPLRGLGASPAWQRLSQFRTDDAALATSRFAGAAFLEHQQGKVTDSKHLPIFWKKCVQGLGVPAMPVPPERASRHPPEESPDGFAGGQALAAKVRPPGIQACRYDDVPLQPVIAMIKEWNLPANVHKYQTVVLQRDTMRTIAGPRTKKTPAPGRGSPTGRCI